MCPETISVVPVFCFPNNISTVEIPFKKGFLEDQSEAVQNSIHSVLYQKIMSLREQCFIFTLDAQHNVVETPTHLHLGDQYLTFICVWFTDLMHINGKLYTV